MTLENTEKYNLLILDDEIEITKSIKRQFRKIYNVFTANNGVDALDLLENKNIQVVISDQRMPGMSGTEFLSIVKKKYPDALKLIITGYSDIEAIIGAVNDGQIFRYITKPWNPIELESILAEAFHKYELITNNKRLTKSLQLSNKQLEEKVKLRTAELEESNDKLKKLNLEKNKYVGIVAHDLRNPIGTAQGFADLLIMDYDNLERADKLDYISNIKGRCAFALDLISDILDLSKIEAGIFELHLHEQDYISFVRENMKQNILFARSKSQILEFKSDLDICLAKFDSNKIEQVLNNLISNAIKYSESNTNISVEVFKAKGNLVTKVIDQGQGIPKDEIETIFTSYKTSSVKSTGDEKSTGLGLAIVKKIIYAHEGSISVKSEVGKGSIFTYSIPVSN